MSGQHISSYRRLGRSVTAPTGVGGSVTLPALDDLTDVDTTGLVDGDTIVWDDGTDTWVPGSGTGNFLTRSDGGGDIVSTVAASGATETIDLADGNLHDVTLSANCVLTFAAVAAGAGRWFTLVLRQNGTGGWTTTWPGSVVWIAGSAPTLVTTASTFHVLVFFTTDGGTTWYGSASGGGGSASPLTTKGDLYGFDTDDARIPVGANGYLLVADSTDAQGIVWENPETTGHWEPLMDGGSPYAPLDDGTGTDWLYVWVA